MRTITESTCADIYIYIYIFRVFHFNSFGLIEILFLSRSRCHPPVSSVAHQHLSLCVNCHIHIYSMTWKWAESETEREQFNKSDFRLILSRICSVSILHGWCDAVFFSFACVRTQSYDKQMTWRLNQFNNFISFWQFHRRIIYFAALTLHPFHFERNFAHISFASERDRAEQAKHMFVCVCASSFSYHQYENIAK